MTGVVLTLRILADAGAMAGPLLVWHYRAGRAEPGMGLGGASGERAKLMRRMPLAANAVAIVMFFSCLWGPFGVPSLSERAALALAAIGLGLVIVGLVVALWARGALGAACSFVPKASLLTGIATSGPYRWVRHPIYLGMAVTFFGAALAFLNWLGMLVVLFLILPTFVWRAAIEERLLVQFFGDLYLAYRRHTKLIVPYVL